ncbi:hypothetical protein HanPI659440_Chr13g0487691 [Helianthus annuus]|nr:hypothetical protein HanPI659440_Chr13g0487691 [Helianthus annuus]
MKSDVDMYWEGVYIHSNPEKYKHVKQGRHVLGGGVLTLEPGKYKHVKQNRHVLGGGVLTLEPGKCEYVSKRVVFVKRQT